MISNYISHFQVYIIPVAGAIIIFAFFFAFGKYIHIPRLWGKKAQSVVNQGITTQSVVAKHEPIDVRLYDSTNRTVYNTKLDGVIADEILRVWHSFGRKWLFQGKWVYAINKYQNISTDPSTGEIKLDDRVMYRPVESRMSATRDNPPSKVHSFLVHPEIAVYFDVSEKQSTLQKLLPVLIFAGGVIFVMFMWSQS